MCADASFGDIIQNSHEANFALVASVSFVLCPRNIVTDMGTAMCVHRRR